MDVKIQCSKDSGVLAATLFLVLSPKLIRGMNLREPKIENRFIEGFGFHSRLLPVEMEGQVRYVPNRSNRNRTCYMVITL